MARPAASAILTEELAVALHDVAWALPRTVGAEVEAELDPLPPSELEVLRLVVDRPGLNLGEVAEELGLQPSNASATVRMLVARGLLERHGDESDGRVTRLAPTQQAAATRRIREQEWGRHLERHLSELSSEQVSLLLAAVPALRALAAQLAPGE
ncbi:MAG TPA: MarR family transcriptional regulator [Solirubrobacteraceae bacterium]|jgi:DNA-binding MarR family transcriptional regulator|nr:MarR family transcriptional regulator [Solirubrobacteraceae bacterium]